MHLSIALDVSHYGLENPTGVERYVDALLPRIVRLLKAKGFVVYLLDTRRVSPAQKLVGAVHVYLPFQRAWLIRQVKPWVETNEISLFFTPSGISPIFNRSKITQSVFTIHDLSIYDIPTAYRPSDWLRFFIQQKAAAKKASLLLVPSEYVKQQVVKRLSPQAKVVVTPLAVSLEGKVKNKALHHSQRIVVIGRIEAKKNLIPLLKAARVGEEYLVTLIGGLGYRGKAYLKECLRAGGKNVEYMGYVSDKERAELMSEAAAVAITSPYEGFGLPVLEAFQANAIAIVAGAGGAAEVAGDAAIVIDKPRAASAWAHGLARLSLLNDKGTATLIKKSQERLKLYDWDATAKQTVEALVSLVKK